MDPFIINYQEIIIESTQTNEIQTACEKYAQYRNEPKRILKKLANLLEKKLQEHYNTPNLTRDLQ